MSDYPYRQNKNSYYPNQPQSMGSTFKNYPPQNRSSFVAHEPPIRDSNIEYVPRIVESGYVIGPPVAYTQQPQLPGNFVPYSPNKSPTGSYIEMNKSRDLSPKNSRIVHQAPPPKITINSQPNYRSQTIIPQKRQIITSNVYSPPSPPPPSPPPPQQISHSYAPQTIPKIQYEKCVIQCKNWQTKYNQLYFTYLNMANSENSSLQIEQLRKQNRNLMSRIKEYQGKQRYAYDRCKLVIKQNIQHYKSSLLKECGLLLDRYRLERNRLD